MKLIKIDGSMGEGGGSVLRTATALSALNRDEIEVYNIRANRANPGLRPQHLRGIEALKRLCNGELEYGEINSKRIKLKPGRVLGGEIRVGIETAGSIGLVLQSLMILAPFADSKVEVYFKGGATDTFFAPSIDYLNNITLRVLNKMGYQGVINQIRRGHYPKGGGVVHAEVRPINKLKSLKLRERGKVMKLKGVSHCVKLPRHIAERQAESAEDIISNAGYEIDIEVESYTKSEDPHLGPGTGIVIWVETEENAVLGSSALGKKGKPAEKVGSEAAENLIRQLDCGCAVDRYLTDQLIPYLALAEGKSEITTTELTSHTLTNIELVEEIMGVEFKVDGCEGETGAIQVNGTGFSR